MLFLLCIALLGCHEDLRERATREAHDFTRKNCPQRLGNGLQMDSMVFEQADSTLHHYYSMSGDGDSFELFREKAKEIRTSMLENIRNDVKMRTFKEAGFKYAVTICSTKHPGQKLFEARYSQKDY